MKVIHLLGELRPAGAELMLRAAAPDLAARGLTSEIVATGASPGPFAPALRAAGFAVHHLPFDRTPGFFLRLRRLLVRGAYDAVHVHAERASFWTGLTALSAAPVVVRTIHSAFEFEGLFRVVRGAQRRALASLGVRHAAVGESVREHERRAFGLEAEVVHAWFDTRRFREPAPGERAASRRALGVPPGRFTVVTVGHCGEVKNHAALLRALALLPPAGRPLWLHVGIEDADGWERRLAAELGVADAVRFLGPLADVRPALHAADLFVMPSLREGFGIAAVEAIATGLPALLARVVGLRDLGYHFSGLRYAEPTPEALATALAVATAEGPERLRAAAQGWPEAARRTFGIDRGVEAYLALYRGR